MNSRRLGVIGLVIAALLVVVPSGVARAHVLKQDHGISAVLHIPPADNPRAGEPTKLYLAFGDPKDSFSLQNCLCQVTIKNNGRLIQTAGLQPALTGASLNSFATVTFPSVSVYETVVTGRAKDGRFPTFKLDFLVRVATTATTPPAKNAGSSVLLIGASSLVVIAVVAAANIRQGGRYSSSPRDKSLPKR